MDSALSPARAVANVRRAVVGACDRDRRRGHRRRRVVARRAAPASAIGIVFEGGQAAGRPGQAPERLSDRADRSWDRVSARRVPVPKGLKIALLHDDSDYGAAGGAALARRVREEPRLRRRRPSPSVRTRSTSHRRSCARGVHTRRRLLVWGEPPTIAAAITAARSSGWNVPVLHTPRRRRSVRSPAARRSPRLARRADVRRTAG